LEGAQQLREEAFRLRKEAVTVHLSCIELLRRYERFASPLERSHIRLKRARYLNDASYYLRCIGDLSKAKETMRECLDLKQSGSVYPNSLATSYGDYGQLLGQLGEFQKAESYSSQSVQIVEQMMASGHDLRADLGMQLIDKGKLLFMLGRLEEAQALFHRGIPLAEATPRRRWATDAEEALHLMDEWRQASPLHQLDWRWFERYRDLVVYDDIDWLTQAGPFTPAEQEEVCMLLEGYDGTARDKRLSVLVVQSRQREVVACLQKEREPQFHYPLIPHAQVQSLLANLSQLKTEIECSEPNSIVRRLYMDAIAERLNELKLVDATARGNDEAFWIYSQRLAAKATLPEMQIAVSQLMQRISQGMESSKTRELSEEMLQKLQLWQLVPKGKKVLNDYQEWKNGIEGNGTNEQRMFSPATLERFFQEVFRTYEFDWTVRFEPAATSERVDLNKRCLILPDRSISSMRVRELLAHEIEIHAFRSMSGARSPLALLSSGLAGYLETEEGLATYYTQEAARCGSGHEPKPKLWIGTLACGLAAGVGCPPLHFRDLFQFVEMISLLIDFLDGKAVPPEHLREKAWRYAQNRCLRTYRGVTHLQPGMCSNKDTNYLRGFLTVSQALQENPAKFERLMCGSVGLHHLRDLAELGILVSPIAHRHLATEPDLDTYMMQFVD
jgi:tetratricopeptide (TPR) repeat protein